MELLDYFLTEVDSDNPYYQFKDDIKAGLPNPFDDVNFPVEKYHITSDKDAINKFRDLIQPVSNYSYEESCKFILICHYLYKKGYMIDEFPQFLDNPTGLPEFAYNQMRTYLSKIGKEEARGIPWQARRDLANTMSFKVIDGFYVKKKMDSLFQMISTRSATFQEMSCEEKLKEIANLLEYLLKNGKKFTLIDTKDVYCSFISNEQIIQYRNKIQCFRHSSKESLIEREKLSNNIEFLISYGLAILAPLNEEI